MLRSLDLGDGPILTWGMATKLLHVLVMATVWRSFSFSLSLSFECNSTILKVRSDGVLAINDAHPLTVACVKLGSNAALGGPGSCAYFDALSLARCVRAIVARVLKRRAGRSSLTRIGLRSLGSNLLQVDRCFLRAVFKVRLEP
jgi:hypothetical protein